MGVKKVSNRRKNIYLMHYTSLGTVKKILGNKCFKFGKIIESDDLEEIKLCEDWKYEEYRYVCFSCSCREKIPMWKLYSCRDTNEEGAIIKFVFDNTSDMENLFDKLDSARGKVKYLIQKDMKKVLKGELKDEFIKGFIKSNYWNFENEYRFISSNFQEMIPLNFDAIKEMYIIISPASPKNGKAIRNEILKELDINKELQKKIHFSKSTLYNKTNNKKLGLK